MCTFKKQKDGESGWKDKIKWLHKGNSVDWLKE